MYTGNVKAFVLSVLLLVADYVTSSAEENAIVNLTTLQYIRVADWHSQAPNCICTIKLAYRFSKFRSEYLERNK
jgi:hypothetical protein